MTTQALPTIAVIEPTWNHHVHFPGNLGLLRVVLLAYPEAKIHFIGGQGQIDLIEKAPLDSLADRIAFTAWETGQDRDTLPTDAYRAIQRFKRLPQAATSQASMLFFCSVTASALNAVNFLGLAPKSYVMLHGNANQLSGWRSRNPIRRHFDFRATLERYSRNGGHTMALEERIVTTLSQQYPWLANSLTTLPHPLTPEEARPNGQARELTTPIKIGFAGNASIEKGFADFLKMAEGINRLHPQQFEFHAIGRLPNESQHLDQSPLTSRATDIALPREEYVTRLDSMHYLFTWHYDTYYGNAASGVVYDAVNMGIPLIARRGAQLSDWHSQGINVALTFDDLQSAIADVANLRSPANHELYARQIGNIETLRDSLSLPNLAKMLRDKFPPPFQTEPIRTASKQYDLLPIE